MCAHLSDDSCASFSSIGHHSRPLALSPQLGQRINGLTVSFIGIYVLYCTVYNLCLFQKGPFFRYRHIRSQASHTVDGPIAAKGQPIGEVKNTVVNGVLNQRCRIWSMNRPQVAVVYQHYIPLCHSARCFQVSIVSILHIIIVASADSGRSPVSSFPSCFPPNQWGN